MKKRFRNKGKNIAAGILLAFSMILGTGSAAVQAEELIIYSEDSTVLDTTDVTVSSAPLTGTYTVADGWTEDSEASTDEETVYKMSSLIGQTDTSTITCSYMDTNYSVLEYEQLRDMLTNSLVYSNVNAQISTSAVYTKEKDCLYIVIVDDSAQEYRDIYHYVVGDYRCFCVEVREYRAEAEQAKAQDQKTPQEAGQKMAEEFVWDTAF